MWRAGQVIELKQRIAELEAQLEQARRANGDRLQVLDVLVDKRELIIRFVRGADRAELRAYAPMGFNASEWRKWLTGS